MPAAPEQLARQQIDEQFLAAGWVVQDSKEVNPAVGRGIALREAPLKSGRCDYLLLVDRKAVGVTEAKKQGTLLSGAAEQSGHYAENLPNFIQSIAPGSLPFLYESTGIETFFRDERDPEPRSRRVFSFHRPETLAALLAEPDTTGAGAHRVTRPTLSRHNRVETERFKSFTYDELTKHDKVNLDIFWLKDDALEESANLPAPEIIAADITADLEAAMEQFATIAEDLKK